MLTVDLIGSTITNIYETKATYDEGIPGPAAYFDIVLEIDNHLLVQLGSHNIKPWFKEDDLFPYTKPYWAVENNFEVIGQVIAEIIQRDSEEYYDGSLTIVMDNGVFLEHQTTNGNQLFIDRLEPEAL